MFLQCIDSYEKCDDWIIVVWLSFHQQDPFGIAQFFGFQLFLLLKEYYAPLADFSGPCLFSLSKQIFIFTTTSDLWYYILVLHYWEDFQLVLPRSQLAKWDTPAL